MFQTPDSLEILRTRIPEKVSHYLRIDHSWFSILPVKAQLPTNELVEKDISFSADQSPSSSDSIHSSLSEVDKKQEEDKINPKEHFRIFDMDATQLPRLKAPPRARPTVLSIFAQPVEATFVVSELRSHRSTSQISYCRPTSEWDIPLCFVIWLGLKFHCAVGQTSLL